MTYQKPITMKFKMIGGQNSVIPNGIVEEIRIQVKDDYASYHFKDAKITKEFAKRQNQDGVKTQYIERLQTALCHYPNMDQKQIVSHISHRIKALENKENEKGGEKNGEAIDENKD
jgi:hypothetical protein